MEKDKNEKQKKLFRTSADQNIEPGIIIST